MYRIHLMVFAMFLMATNAHANIFGTCSIEEGEMIGYIHNQTSSSIWISGDVTFTLYNKSFRILDEYSTRKSGSLSRGVHKVAKKKISSADLPRATHCSLDISDAIGQPNSQSESYLEFCSLEK